MTDRLNQLSEFLSKIIEEPNNKKERIFDYYLPLYQWFYQQYQKFTFEQKQKVPFFIGISAPQGAGKTTLTQFMMRLFQHEKISSVTISIDDFYLSRVEQVALAKKYTSEPYLQQRGYPGTHDVSLGVEVLSALKEVNQTHNSLLIPRYNKSAYNGKGDRYFIEDWTPVTGPIDIVFVEGWMLGFQPLSNLSHINPLYQVNEFLKAYSSWNIFFNAFVHLYTQKFEIVLRWRLEAEQKMKGSGREGMSDQEVIKYTEKFRPAYEIYVPQLLSSPPVSTNLQIEISEKRLPMNAIRV